MKRPHPTAAKNFYASLNLPLPCSPRRIMLDWEDDTVTAALAFPGVRVKLRGAYVHAAMVGAPIFGSLPFGDVGAAVSQRLISAALRRAALLGDTLVLALPGNAPQDWQPVAWAETADIDCASAPPPQENSFAPLKNHIQQWHRALQVRAGQYGASVCASSVTLAARLEAHLTQPGAEALAGLHPEGRMAGWWLGFCGQGRAHTVFCDGDEAFLTRLPGLISRLGAESLHLVKPVTPRTQQWDPVLHGRILNIDKLLPALPVEGESMAVINIEDPVFPENHGRWRVEGRTSGVTCLRVEDEGTQPALVTAGEMAALLFGDTMSPRGDPENCLDLAHMFPPITPYIW
ncbi:MAG: sterol carrier protein domain-containing protein [Clostridia bacterium]|nr:sterol carrier protein domain-containing protein [Clostridia bacterium]